MRCDAGTFRDTAFAAAGPRLWNRLPSHLKEGGGFIVQLVPAVAKDMFVRIVGLQRSK